MESNFVNNQIQYLSTGSTRQALGIQVIRKMSIAKPTYNEQKDIADYLDKTSNDFNRLIENCEQIIKLLKEYRKVLISDVVTGKIDVRNEVIS